MTVIFNPDSVNVKKVWGGMSPVRERVITDVYKPTPTDLKRYADQFGKLVDKVVEENGDTKIALDTNGGIVAVENKENLAPLVMLAGLAWLLVGA